jgi:hypothetical protein
MQMRQKHVRKKERNDDEEDEKAHIRKLKV